MSKTIAIYADIRYQEMELWYPLYRLHGVDGGSGGFDHGFRASREEWSESGACDAE